MDLLLHTLSSSLAAESDADLGAVALRLSELRQECKAEVAGLVYFESGPRAPIVFFESDDETADLAWLGALSAQREWWGDFRARRVHAHDNLLRRERHESSAPDATRACTLVESPDLALTAFVVGGEPRLESLEAAAAALGPVIPSALSRQRGREETLRQLLSSLTVGALVLGQNGRLRIANEAARKLFQLPEGRSDLGDIQRCSGLSLGAIVKAAQGSPIHVRSEVEGPVGPLRIEARAIREDSSISKQAPVLMVLDDLSERRRLARHQREFLSTVGHELRTPLTSLSAAFELLASEGEVPQQDRARLGELCDRNVQRLARLVEQLLDTASAQSGQLVLDLQSMSLEALLTPFFDEMTARSVGEDKAFEAHIDNGAVAWIDPVRFVEIAENLVDNALKFTGPGASIRVDVRVGVESPMIELSELASAFGLPASGCELTVEDDGPGMDAFKREQVLEPFFQEGDPDADRPSGSGLGLSIVAGLVKSHSGWIELGGDPGVGTTVQVWVPSTQELAVLAAAVRDLESELHEAARSGTGRWMRLVVQSTRAESDLTHVIPLAGAWELELRATEPESGADDRPVWTRVGHDGEAIGTTLARLAEESVASSR